MIYLINQSEAFVVFSTKGAYFVSQDKPICGL